MKNVNTISLKEVGIFDIDQVGGKNASLGEMINGLADCGINVPMGYAVTVNAYKLFIAHNVLEGKIQGAIRKLNVEDMMSLQTVGKEVRGLILGGVFPLELSEEILSMYDELSDESSSLLDVAVRSSATAEDLPDASFAGQQETFLNVRGEEDLLLSIKKCFASLY